MVKPASQARGRGGSVPGQKPVLLRFGRWLLVLLILLAFARAVWALGDKSFWWDESLSLHRTQRSLAYTLSNQIILTDNVGEEVTIDNHPPLYFLLLWVAARLFGQSEFALRFLSLAALVSIVPLLYVTGRQIVDERAGLAAAALAALSPMYLWYGQEARMYALVALLSLLSFYLFFRTFFGSPELLNMRGRWRWVAAYVLASICLILTHHLGALLIAFQIAALGLVGLRRAELRKTLVLTIAVVVSISVVALGYAWLTRPKGPRLPGFDFLPLQDLLRDLLNSFSLGLSVDVGDWYVLAIDLVFLLFLAAGLVWLVRPAASRQDHTAGWLLAGYLFLPILLIYALSYAFPVYMNSRHLIVISPAFYLLVGVGLTRWRGRFAWVLVPLTLLMIAGMSYSTYNYFVNPGYDKDQHREWGAYLRQQARPGDVVVVNPPHIADLYEYYAGSNVPWIGLPMLGKTRQESEARLGELLEQYDRVWLALSSTPPWGDWERVPESWLNENAFRAARVSFRSYASRVLVALYLPGWPSVPDLPDDARPLETRFTPQLRLAGYRLASPAESGKPVDVEVFWAVDDYLPEQASVLLRLVDEQGHLWGEGQHCPFNELYPMWQWQPGLLLRDEYQVPISPGTPPGEYQLELGLVSRPTEDGCSGSAGPLVQPISAPPGMHRGDRVLLGTVGVQRPAEPPDREALGIERQHRARFGGLELLGAEVVPSEIKAGERLHLTLYWQAQESLLGEERFRLRLVDPDGVTQQEAVIRPGGNGRPAGGWLAGDRYRGQFWLQLPEEMPEGRYRLELLPEPPLQRSGAWATVRRWLGAGEASVNLGSVDVEALAFHQPSVPVPLPTDLVLSHPLLATLGDRVRFLGYELDSDSVLAGETVSVTLYWQALSPMDFDYSVFTHLLGPANEVLAQDDGTPRDGTRPTTLWEPGEVVADPYSLVIGPDVPPGSYPLEIGMYRLETGVRLPVVDAGGQPVPHDRILLTSINVLRAPATP